MLSLSLSSIIIISIFPSLTNCEVALTRITSSFSHCEKSLRQQPQVCVSRGGGVESVWLSLLIVLSDRADNLTSHFLSQVVLINWLHPLFLAETDPLVSSFIHTVVAYRWEIGFEVTETNCDVSDRWSHQSLAPFLLLLWGCVLSDYPLIIMFI